MSHELRTPLNSILGYAQILHLESEARGEERILPELGRIQAAGKHLLTIISNILDFSKIEQGKMDLQVVVVTGHVTRDDIVRAQQVGCDDLVSKPIDYHVLIGKVGEYLPAAEPPS